MPDAPAIALIEYASIALGTRASDALAKKAQINILRAGTLQPGKYAILFEGDVASVDESYVEALRVGAESVIDRILLPDAHAQVRAAIAGDRPEWAHECLGIIETTTLAAVLEAADAAVKGTSVRLLELRLADGLGGKGLLHLGGLQADVEAAIEIGTSRIAYRDQKPCAVVIPRFDDDLRAKLEPSTRFGEGW